MNLKLPESIALGSVVFFFLSWGIAGVSHAWCKFKEAQYWARDDDDDDDGDDPRSPIDNDPADAWKRVGR